MNNNEVMGVTIIVKVVGVARIFTKTMFLGTILLSMLFAVRADESSQLPGHMEPLGSHRPPNQLERLVVPPSPLQFAEYVTRRQPVVMEQLMRNTEVIKNWQSDDYLKYVAAYYSSGYYRLGCNLYVVGRGLGQLVLQ